MRHLLRLVLGLGLLLVSMLVGREVATLFPYAWDAHYVVGVGTSRLNRFGGTGGEKVAEKR